MYLNPGRPFANSKGQGAWGSLREEGGRGMLSRYDQTHVDLFVHEHDWNFFQIWTDDHHITVLLNGVRTVDIVDEAGALTGAIAFHLRAAVGQRTEAWFRHARLTVAEREWDSPGSPAG